MQVKCTETQARALLASRELSRYDRKMAKRRIFAEIRRDHPSLRVRKFVLFIENPDNELYRVLRDKRTKLPVDDGRPEPVIALAPEVKKPAAKKPAAKVAAKKPAAKKAPVIKPKAPAKAVARPAKTLARPSKPKASAAPKKAKK